MIVELLVWVRLQTHHFEEPPSGSTSDKSLWTDPRWGYRKTMKTMEIGRFEAEENTFSRNLWKLEWCEHMKLFSTEPARPSI